MGASSRDRDQHSPLPIPLPTELPAAPDLSRLPAHILHSGTVETLIGQNDDLMARLKVNIRRNSVLEQQIMEHERVGGELMRANQSLMSQLQILQEKDKLLREKTARAENQQDDLKEEITLLKTMLDAAEERIETLRPSERYRSRIRSIVRPFVDRLKSQLKAERATVFAREAAVSDLRAKLSEALDEVRELERKSARDQTRLVEHYEKSQTEMSAELEKLRTETQLLRDKASRFEVATEKRADAENRNIYLERQVLDLNEKCQLLKKEAETRAQEINSAKDAQAVAELELSKLRDQFESLQTVWAETEKKMENSKLQHEALNRLNQELSRQLKEKKSLSPSGETGTTLDC